jgi:hypothetical protein
MLSHRCLQIVKAMFTEHGVLAGTDLARLRAPLQEPLSALADLERHMNKFMLAAKKLTASGQGKTSYEYFEVFMETVQDFPVVPQSMSTYYAVQPTVDMQTIDSLFLYLKSQHPYMLRTSGASPFSGAVTPAPAPAAAKHQRHKKGKQQKWGPNEAQRTRKHRGSFAGNAQGPHGLSLEALSLQSQVQQLTALLAQSNANVAAAMMDENFGSSSVATGYGVPTVPSAFFGTQARPFYCYVHGYNNSHNSAQCNVMAQDPQYTADMRAAISPATEGNPNVGPPVSRPMMRAFHNPVVCSPCSFPSLAQASAIKRPPPNDENGSARLATRADARYIRGHNRLSRARVDELSMPAQVSTVPVSMHVVPVVSTVPVSMHVVPVVSMPLPEVSCPLPKVKTSKQARTLKKVRFSLPRPQPTLPAIVLPSEGKPASL